MAIIQFVINRITKICSQFTYRLRDCWRRLLCSSNSDSSSDDGDAITVVDGKASVRAPRPSTNVNVDTSKLDGGEVGAGGGDREEDAKGEVEKVANITSIVDETSKNDQKEQIQLTSAAAALNDTHQHNNNGHGQRRNFALSISRALLGGCNSRSTKKTMGTAVSVSSPEPEERNVVERALRVLNQKPLRMGSMLRLSRLMNDAGPQEKLLLLNSGVIKKLLEMIDERSHVIPKSARDGKVFRDA